MSGIVRILSSFSLRESGVVSCVISEVWEEEPLWELPSEGAPEDNENNRVEE